MILTAVITEAHIARGQGERDNPHCCPASWAIRDALPPGVRVMVSGPHYYVNGRPYVSPPELVKFVGEFDRAGVVAHCPPPLPVSFPLEVEDGVFAEPYGAAA